MVYLCYNDKDGLMQKKKKSSWAGLLARLWGCLEPRYLSLLKLPGHMGAQAIWMGGRGCWLGSLPGQDCSFMGSQVLWPGFLSARDCRGCRPASLSRHGARSGSTVTIAHWLGDQDQTGLPTSSQHHPWAPWPDRAAYSALQLGRAPAGPLLWARMRSTRIWELALSPIPCGWVLDSPSDSHETRPKWAFQEASCNTGAARCQPGTLVLPWRNLKPREGPGRLSALSLRPRGEAMQLVELQSYPSHASFSLSHPKGCFSLSPGFWDFPIIAMSMERCSAILWGLPGNNSVPILMTSPAIRNTGFIYLSFSVYIYWEPSML